MFGTKLVQIGPQTTVNCGVKVRVVSLFYVFMKITRCAELANQSKL